MTWGEWLTVRIDAVLRGALPLTTTRLFNPPLGLSGWPDFDVGGQYLIIATTDFEEGDGRISTFLCAPNEEITSPDRFRELVALSAHPHLPATNVPMARSTNALVMAGIGMIAVGLLLGVRRTIAAHERVHR